jgi:hypothetical protein
MREDADGLMVLPYTRMTSIHAYGIRASTEFAWKPRSHRPSKMRRG